MFTKVTIKNLILYKKEKKNMETHGYLIFLAIFIRWIFMSTYSLHYTSLINLFFSFFFFFTEHFWLQHRFFSFFFPKNPSTPEAGMSYLFSWNLPIIALICMLTVSESHVGFYDYVFSHIHEQIIWIPVQNKVLPFILSKCNNIERT